MKTQMWLSWVKAVLFFSAAGLFIYTLFAHELTQWSALLYTLTVVFTIIAGFVNVNTAMVYRNIVKAASE